MDECADHMIGDDVVMLLDAYKLAEHGVMPVAGGFLDQSKQFLRAREIVSRLWGHEHDGAVKRAQI